MDSSSANSQNQGDIDFHHPYTPYDVQLEFMKTAYNVLDHGNGQIGILESPTGTGKSLSLICASMTWLRNFKRKEFGASLQIDPKAAENEPEWIIEQMLRRKRNELVTKWEEREARLEKIRQREKRMEERGSKRRRLDGPSSSSKRKEEDEEAEFLLDDWVEDNGVRESHQKDPLAGLSKETRALLQKVGMGSSEVKGDEDEAPDNEMKIYYTSRTHSQLSQFIAELRRPDFPTSLPEDVAPQDDTLAPPGKEPVKHIPLSSRQKLCINPAVSKLSSLAAINDKCSELQKPKSKAKCPFVPNADNLAETHQFRDAALATLPDIEDLYELGKSHSVCPYYASRTAIPTAEIITLPYPLLLQETAREALGIKLEGNVVIIDEAHNIMDAVANVHAAEIKLSELKRARQMLGVYFKRFGKKLKGENRIMVAQVVKVIDGLTEWLAASLIAKGEHGIVDPNALLKSKGIDQINLFKLIKYIQESKLAFKVESYASHIEEGSASEAPTRSSPSSPVLHALVSFIVALTNPSDEGRIFYEKTPTPPDIKLSYLLLSPTHAFSSIATSARAVILAGGTMSPFDDYKTHLFPYLKPENITSLSCGHVIPSSNLCVWTLASMRPSTAGAAPNPYDLFEFSFQKRSDKSMIRRLGQALLNTCSVVPDGVVVFFPSYGYLDEVVGVWQSADGGDKSVWERLQAKKAVFREQKGGSSDEVLEKYSHAILGDPAEVTKPGGARGALLLSVVGGKMSEGINFSDRLGRCVVIIGLPYPNINSPEWKARIEYIESATVARLTSPTSDTNPSMTKEQATTQAKQVARDFYENACMRAVNQSIGRAIRHRGDYSAIILVDRRFGTERIRGKLPGWIRGGMVEGSESKGLQGLMGSLNIFFKGRKGS
ncbi:ATP-dependent RNA helicase chl1 [Cytospora mali]|uniref:ATP-dependent DNA helicase CHL1 n=1 Tax=Cytospora mali TaxID=578113 RepID=A0A194VF29_CYTMA|nr:ATP-dependent RNA helicase chl1 [Valsa mali var. pyri (nom. inval.)]